MASPTSSVFEARLAREVLGARGVIHITNPGMRADEVADAASLCDYVSFNSLSQWELYSPSFANRSTCGIRVNPGMSLVRDIRYDPCRENSKLGLPVEYLEEIHRQVPYRINGMSGLHFHTNSEANEFTGLLATVRHLEDRIKPFLKEIDWINLGGGYLFDNPDSLGDFHECVNLLKNSFGLTVFVEPGTALVRRSCYLVASVRRYIHERE